MHIPLIASLLAFVLGVLSALHVYWAFGGRSGSVTVIPHVDGRPVFSPSRTTTLLVAACLAAAALVALVIGTVFLLRLVGFFKSVRGTPFATWDNWPIHPFL